MLQTCAPKNILNTIGVEQMGARVERIFWSIRPEIRG